MSVYQELTSYCPIRDAEVTRLSTVNARGHEYFAIIPRDRPRQWRKVRENVLQALEDAISAGAQPGEFNIELDQ